jgi:hypothetical protein
MNSPTISENNENLQQFLHIDPEAVSEILSSNNQIELIKKNNLKIPTIDGYRVIDVENTNDQPLDLLIKFRNII